MPHTTKGKKCVYATLQGRDRTLAFKKWIKNKLNHRDKKPRPKNRDKDGNFIVTKNHVSQIMKRRAETARRNKEISKEIYKTYAERQAAEERAEHWNRIFFGEITPKMKYEMQEEERIKKLHEENRKKIQNMPYEKWINMFYADYYIGRDIDLRANRIRHYWKLKSRRLNKKKSRKVHFDEVVRKIEYTYVPVEYITETKLKNIQNTTKKYKEPGQKQKPSLLSICYNLNGLLKPSRDSNEDHMDWANSNEPIDNDDDWSTNEDSSDSW